MAAVLLVLENMATSAVITCSREASPYHYYRLHFPYIIYYYIPYLVHNVDGSVGLDGCMFGNRTGIFIYYRYLGSLIVEFVV